jgi:hypothetical protein
MTIRPEFREKILALEKLLGVDFTAKEEKQIMNADQPMAKAKEIAKIHHAPYQSRKGGRFFGAAAPAYRKARDGQ